MTFKVAAACLAGVVCATAPAAAQPDLEDRQTTSRPATTTSHGDTGLWFVPTGEILARGNWSISGYRVNFDYEQGFTDVASFPATFGAGIGERVEVFAAFTPVIRIDRDFRPLFLSTAPDTGGVVNEHPFVSRGWSGNRVGDLWTGAKLNLMSQSRRQAAAVAVRGMLKIPTGDSDDGPGTGKLDLALDVIASREVNARVELSAFGGVIVRGDPDEYDLLNGVRWGFGAGLPTRTNLKLTTELHGERYFDDAVLARGPVAAVVGEFPPIGSRQTGPVNATIGLTWQSRRGMFAGVGVNYNLRLPARSDAGAFSAETGDALGFQLRAGYHPGVRRYVAPPLQQSPPSAAVPANRPPAVRARCEPCTVEPGGTSALTAEARDPDGDTLVYRWGTAAGRLGSPSDRQTPWTAPMDEGPVPVTIEVTDGRGGAATDAVTLQVVRRAVIEVVFEDVHFDFDRYSLRPEATRALEEVVKALEQDPRLRLQIEGHTCSIGTAEYNLALGERRAVSVRVYLAERGIGSDRLQTVSYGEERPKHDNGREETRRLNRRASLVVRLER